MNDILMRVHCHYHGNWRKRVFACLEPWTLFLPADHRRNPNLQYLQGANIQKLKSKGIVFKY